VGYKGVRIPGVAFDERSGTIPNAKGRCLDGKESIPGLYVTGWIKRGPSGLIGTNRADSVETVASIFEDIPSLESIAKGGANALRDVLDRAPRIISYKDWQSIDLSERQRGKQKGKPREKFTRVAEMIETIEGVLQHD
jgi:ferredoxin--NADP+ reductase